MYRCQPRRGFHWSCRRRLSFFNQLDQLKLIVPHVVPSEIEPPDLPPRKDEGGTQFAIGTLQIDLEWIVASAANLLLVN